MVDKPCGRSRIQSRIGCDDQGRIPAFPADSPFQGDPHWRDGLQFYEYFHRDTGQLQEDLESLQGISITKLID